MRGEGGEAGDGRSQASHRGQQSDQGPALTVHPQGRCHTLNHTCST